jgi:hypothetical protein
MNQLNQPIAITKKWANGTNNINDVVIPQVQTDQFKANQEIGFPPSQEQDPNTGGTYVKRAEMNGVFKLYSEHIEFLNKGGNYTFNTDIATAGGYSTGATLWSDYYKRFVTSLKDNNTDNFTTDPKLINGISWDFTELSEYINIPEVATPQFAGNNGESIVVFCSKKKYLKHTLNALVKFSFATGTSDITTYTLRIEGNPLITQDNNLIEYQTGILSNYNNTGATFEIITYGGYLGALETKPADYVIVALKLINRGNDNLKMASPYKLIDISIESTDTIVPVIGMSLAQCNNYLGTALTTNTTPAKLLYYPSITDNGATTTINPTNDINLLCNNSIGINTDYINIITNHLNINGNSIIRTKKIDAYRIVGNFTAIKINFKQNPALNEIVYLILFDFVVFEYPRAGYLDVTNYGINAGNIDFGGVLGANESFGSGSVVIDSGINNGIYAGLCSFRYSNQNIPEKNKITWGSSATSGTGRFHITFYANSLNNNF